MSENPMDMRHYVSCLRDAKLISTWNLSFFGVSELKPFGNSAVLRVNKTKKFPSVASFMITPKHQFSLPNRLIVSYDLLN